jgi:nucleoside-diphosphate-sugar epimerase
VKHALVTGDKGFVGRHFSRHLKAQGWDVLGMDIKDGLSLGDARDFFRGRDYYPHFDLVVHCAAIVGGREVIDGAPLALAPNLELDAGLFQWALRARPARVIYLSSSAVYPNRLQEEPRILREEEVLHDFGRAHVLGVPDQLYGWAKLTGENLAHRARQEGLKVSVVRPFSGYGEDQDAVYPFPAFIDRALRREDPFTVWGNGEQVRDFIHISDITGAVMAMVNEGIDGPVNLATGRPVSLNELARLVCAIAGYSPEVAHVPGKPSGVAYRVGSAARLQQFYTPEITLEDGIAAALEYRSQS